MRINPLALAAVTTLTLAACGQVQPRETLAKTNVTALTLLPSDPTAIFYEQLNEDESIGSTYYGSNYEKRVADDFYVPYGGSLRLAQVLVQAAASNSLAKGLNVEIYPDDGGYPAATPLKVYPYVTGAVDGPSDGMYEYLLDLEPPLDLFPGKYWLSVYHSTNAVEVFEWFENKKDVAGYPLMYWTATDCSIWCTYLDKEDLGFALIGTEVPPPALTIFQTGSINKASGVASVSGTASCGTERTLSLRVELRQRQSRTPVEGFTDITFKCEGDTPWAAAIKPTKGGFKSGPADAAAEMPGAVPSNRTLKTIGLK